MASASIFEFVLLLVWTLLTLTPVTKSNHACDIILLSQDVISKIMSDSLLSFAPGLLDVVQAATPPSIAFFKTLPTQFKKLWGVYVIVLEKKGCRPKVYIGSSTESDSGVIRRMRQYDALSLLPRFVDLALKNGYRITHKSLLCWAPLPGILAGFPLRVLFIVLETAFSIVFWTMSFKSNYGWMPKHLCPWKIDAFEYDGCCSHPAIGERIEGDTENLTPEQLEAKEAGRKQHKKDYMSNLAASNKAERRYECKTCNLPFESHYLLKKHNRTKLHVNKVNGVPRTKHQEYADANVAAKRYYCKPCRTPFPTKSKLGRHLKTQTHAAAVDKAAQAAESSSMLD